MNRNEFPPDDSDVSVYDIRRRRAVNPRPMSAPQQRVSAPPAGARVIRVVLLAVMDLALAAGMVGLFMLWHHVLPRAGTAQLTIIDDVRGADTPEPTANGSAAVEEPKSAFPNYDTGVGALQSYQSDNLRIAVTETHANGVAYFVADVWVRDIRTFRTAFAKNQYGQGIIEGPTTIAQNNNAILAVTGDYYGARLSGVVIRNGTLYRNSLLSDICVLYVDGVMETYTPAEFDINEAIARGAWQAWSFGPELLVDGLPVSEFTDEFAHAIRGLNPRCGIGYYEPGHYCLVVVDGRQPDWSQGMTLADMSTLFADLGCKAAYNLDGGQTAKMLFGGEAVSRAYNGGRPTSDIIYFTE